jgi:hypothetical protein
MVARARFLDSRYWVNWVWASLSVTAIDNFYIWQV